MTTVNPDGSTTTVNPDGTVTTTPATGTTTGMDGTTVATDGTTTTDGSTTSTGDGTTATPGDVELPTCVQGVPATTQVSRLLNREYDRAVEDLLGLTALDDGTPPSSQLNADYEGPMDTFVWNAYQEVGAQIASQVISGANRSRFLACDPATVTTCWDDTIRAFGQKAFRRPMTDEEVTRFMSLTTIQPAGTTDEIAEALLFTFLISPSFIMTPEMGGTADATTGAIALDGNQVATRLALMLWGSVPDDTLLQAGTSGQLSTPEQILAQAQRMLTEPVKAGQQMAMAHRNYLVMDDSSHWWKISHPSETFPNYSDELRPTLQAELDAFFQDVVFSGGSFKDLFLSTTGFVNQGTASLYGVDGTAMGTDLAKVDLSNRPGFLTRAGFLSSFSSPEATSPILRGAFITVNVLGVDPGAPIDGATGTPIPPGDYTTRRQQIEALTEPAECTGCHTPLVNPPGFVLENYNAVGSWQDTDPLGGPIDPSATVTFSGSNSKTIASAQEMMTEIANTPKAQLIYLERLVSYAMGRLPNENDACIVNDLYAKFSAPEGYAILDAFADMTQADSFRLRTVGN